jgi:hypothetical protein
VSSNKDVEDELFRVKVRDVFSDDATPLLAMTHHSITGAASTRSSAAKQSTMITPGGPDNETAVNYPITTTSTLPLISQHIESAAGTQLPSSRQQAHGRKKIKIKAGKVMFSIMPSRAASHE